MKKQLLTLFLILTGITPVLAQNWLSDTSYASTLLQECNMLRKERKFNLVFQKLDSIESIYQGTVGENSAQFGNLLHSKALSLQLIGKFDSAISLYKKAIELRTVVLGDKSLELAKSFNNLGNCYSEKREYMLSAEYHKKALEIRLTTPLSKNQFADISCNNIGYSLMKYGNFRDAIKYLQKGIGLNLAAGSDPSIAGILYNNLGFSFQSLGDCRQAISFHLKAIEIQTRVLGEKHPSTIGSIEDLGSAYSCAGDYQNALLFHQKSINLKSEVLGATNYLTASAYINLALDYKNIQQYEQAIRTLQTCLEKCESNLEENYGLIPAVFDQLAINYKLKGDPGKAIEFHNLAFERAGKNYSISASDSIVYYSHLGDCYLRSKNYTKSIELAEKALKINRFYSKDLTAIQNQEWLTASLSLAGLSHLEIYKQSGQKAELLEASKWLNAAKGTVFLQLKNWGRNHLRLSNAQLVYENLIRSVWLLAEMHLDKSLLNQVFETAEISKSIQLTEAIQENQALSFSGIPDSLLNQERELRIELTWREKQRQELLDKNLSETDTNVLRISSILFDLEQKYDTLKTQFEKQFPEYYRLKYDFSTVSLEYVQNSLLDKNQAMLEYFCGDSSIYLMLIRPDTFVVREVKRDFPLENWIEQLRQGLYGYFTTPDALKHDTLYDRCLDQYLALAPKLYEKLIAPVASLLPERVIIVPDGPLGYIPFDALLSEKPKDENDLKRYPYLTRKYQFSYTYSATLLREMRDKKHRREPEKPFIAFAPYYNGDTSLLAGMYSYDQLMRKDLQPLKFSGPEVAAASKLMRGELIAGPAATEQQFIENAGKYRVIHLATHGRADNRVGDYAFLAFSEIKDSIENELLYVKDLYNLELNADLVVLSACETGIGKLQRGEGIISLARAFAYAGAKSIVTTLWEVNDKSTSELMRYFYRELQHNRSKDEALRMARLRFWKEQPVELCHPFYWAAFVAVGDMRSNNH